MTDEEIKEYFYWLSWFAHIYGGQFFRSLPKKKYRPQVPRLYRLGGLEKMPDDWD